MKKIQNFLDIAAEQWYNLSMKGGDSNMAIAKKSVVEVFFKLKKSFPVVGYVVGNDKSLLLVTQSMLKGCAILGIPKELISHIDILKNAKK